MRRAAARLATLATILVLLAPSAGAETAKERIDRHRADVRAKVACNKRQASGKPCAPAAVSGSRDSHRASSAPRGRKLIEISVSDQTLHAWEGDQLRLSTGVSTGSRGKETPLGRFAVQSKETMHWSNKYKVWMPYAMRVVGGIFIHEIPIHPDGYRIGSNSIGRAVSGGCIRVPIGTAQALYNWTSVGTPVWIH